MFVSSLTSFHRLIASLLFTADLKPFPLRLARLSDKSEQFQPKKMTKMSTQTERNEPHLLMSSLPVKSQRDFVKSIVRIDLDYPCGRSDYIPMSLRQHGLLEDPAILRFAIKCLIKEHLDTRKALQAINVHDASKDNPVTGSQQDTEKHNKLVRHRDRVVEALSSCIDCFDEINGNVCPGFMRYWMLNC